MASYAVPVTAFIDWNSQIHGARLPRSDPNFIAVRTLEHIGRVIGRTLETIDTIAPFDVSLRIYHGWHKGFEPTPNRRALVTAAAGADFAALSRTPQVSIRPEIQFGDRLLSALGTRLHPRLGIHLPATLRSVGRAGSPPEDLQEKMVDTAIAADIVDLAHREPDRWIIVLGDDDDLVPPLYTAEAIRVAARAKTLLVSARSQGPFLRLDGTLVGQ